MTINEIYYMEKTNKIILTKQEFQDKILLKVQEEAKRTGRPEIEILNEVAEKMRQRMQGGSFGKSDKS